MRNDSCIYCGSRDDLTRDHIPPRAVFPVDPKYRVNLITVPSCRRCNKKYSDDDEYFAFFIAGNRRTAMSPASATLHARIGRGIKHTRRGKLGQRIRKSLRLVDARTPAGIVVGRQPVMHIDRPIMRRVGQRIVRGLYFHHLQDRVPDHLNVDFVVLADIALRTVHEKVQIETTQRLFCAEPLHNIGPDVFTYRFRQGENGRSIWVMTLYDAVECIGVIQPEPTTPNVAVSFSTDIQVWPWFFRPQLEEPTAP
jgi:hypothetical protein